MRPVARRPRLLAGLAVAAVAAGAVTVRAQADGQDDLPGSPADGEAIAAAGIAAGTPGVRALLD